MSGLKRESKIDSLVSITQPVKEPKQSRLQMVPTHLSLTLLVADVLALMFAAFSAFWLTRWVQESIFGIPSYIMGPAVLSRGDIYIALCLGLIVSMANKNAYDARLPWWSQVQSIAKLVLVAFLVDGFISFAMKTQASRMLIISNWVFAFGLLLTFRFAVFHMASKVREWKVPTVIMADNDMATDLMLAFHNEPCTGYHVHTVFLRDDKWRDFDRTALPPKDRNVLIHVGMSDCAAYVLEHPDNFYIISMDAFRGDVRDQLIRALDKVQANYALVPSLALSGFHGTMPHYYFGHDVMMIPASIPGRNKLTVGRVAKRLMDIMISALALVLLAPLLLLVAAMLKIEGQGGSIFYGGQRVGKGGRMFHCWKFRSMEPDSDHLLQEYIDSDPLIKARWEKYRKLPKDPRINTKTAAIIRKLSIDELPQLWNVLVGDMSLVGPRPILAEETHYFGRRLRHYLSVRPGLTGLWQVSGRNNTSFMRRVYWDSWYVRNWSLWHDIIIMFKTPLVLISGKGAY
ncbi:MAG: exopolysaccharide biosynthesis polyprenyl glycosylphosphotransferase [Alphaproteobacteria bacterium]